MLNLYSVTNLDGWTAGKQNRSIKHEERTPNYYEYADSPEQAIEQARHYHFADKRLDLDAVLIQKNVKLPLEPLAEKASAK